MLSIRDGPDVTRGHVKRLHLGEPGLKSAIMSKNYGTKGKREKVRGINSKD